MAYTKNTNFTAKDALSTGNPAKVIKGSEFDGEFDEIATESAKAAEVAATNTFTGNNGFLAAASGLTRGGSEVLVASDISSSVQPYDADTPTVVVSQVDAEAGTATDNRTWTAVRVKQAIVALAPSVITLGTPVATTSGTSIDFTGIPSGTKRITVGFSGVSTNGTSALLLRLGDAGGIEATGYVGTGSDIAVATAASSDETTGLSLCHVIFSGNTHSGQAILSLIDSSTNTWVMTSALGNSATIQTFGAADKSLSAELDRIRVTTAGGSDTFDAGKINITYE